MQWKIASILTMQLAQTVTEISSVFFLLELYNMSQGSGSQQSDSTTLIWSGVISTVPLLVSSYNFFYLSDVIGYVSDIWLQVPLLTVWYAIVLFYSSQPDVMTVTPFLGVTFGETLQWEFLAFMIFGSLGLHSANAYLSQANRERWEFELDWFTEGFQPDVSLDPRYDRTFTH